MSLQRFDVETNFVVRRRKHGKETGWEKNQREGERKKRKLGKNICSMYLSLSLSLSVSLCISVSLFLSLSLTHTYTVHTQKLGSVDNIESNNAIVVNVYVHYIVVI
jgi:hypothetical protein